MVFERVRTPQDSEPRKRPRFALSRPATPKAAKAFAIEATMAFERPPELLPGFPIPPLDSPERPLERLGRTGALPPPSGGAPDKTQSANAPTSFRPPTLDRADGSARERSSIQLTVSIDRPEAAPPGPGRASLQPPPSRKPGPPSFDCGASERPSVQLPVSIDRADAVGRSSIRFPPSFECSARSERERPPLAPTNQPGRPARNAIQFPPSANAARPAPRREASFLVEDFSMDSKTLFGMLGLAHRESACK
jgi:hypothetical protein